MMPIKSFRRVLQNESAILSEIMILLVNFVFVALASSRHHHAVSVLDLLTLDVRKNDLKYHS